MEKPKNINVLIILFIVSGISISAYAAQSITDRILIDEDDIPLDLAALDRFGYQIEAIGDLDSDGTIDFAVTKFTDDSGEANAGSVLIVFMNSDGTVKATNEITQTGDAGNITSDCMAPDSTNRETTTLEQLAFLGDLDGDGEPTLAIGAADNDHGVSGSGAIYNLELNSDGTVDNCFLIHPNNATHTSGFAPGNGVYQEGADGAFLGWPLIATDLNDDGRLDLIAGASNEADTSTNLWPLFLNTTGGVDSHPATPIFATTDLNLVEFIDDGAPVDGKRKIVLGIQSGSNNAGNVIIADLTSTGAFTSFTNVTNGDAPGDALGSGVTPLVDLDNDGVIDILVGNELGDDDATNSGEATILYLNSDNTVKESQLITNATEATRTGTEGPLKMTDLFGHGMSLWRTTTETAYFAVSAHQSDNGGSNTGSFFIFAIEIAQDVVAAVTTTEEDTGKSGGHGKTGVDTGQSIKKSGNNCKSSVLGKGISMKVYDIIYDHGIVTINAKSTCGPLKVQIATDYGRESVGMNQENPVAYDEDGNIKYSIYSKMIDKSLKSFRIIIQDKRDTFTDEIQIGSDEFVRHYSQGTGYTSEQQSTEKLLITPLELPQYKSEIPSWIKSEISHFNGHPGNDVHFFDTINRMIDGGHIQYNDWPKSDSLQELQTYPQWVLEYVSFYTHEQMTEEEFVQGLEYLIEERIIRIGR